MLESHPKYRLNSIVPHVCVVLNKKIKRWLHHGYRYFILFNADIVRSQQSLMLGLPDDMHMAVLSSAVPGTACFSISRSPQPRSGCPEFTAKP